MRALTLSNYVSRLQSLRVPWPALLVYGGLFIVCPITLSLAFLSLDTGTHSLTCSDKLSVIKTIFALIYVLFGSIVFVGTLLGIMLNILLNIVLSKVAHKLGPYRNSAALQLDFSKEDLLPLAIITCVGLLLMWL
jgi:hypothetical protein